jgi:hypothetical protein
MKFLRKAEAVNALDEFIYKMRNSLKEFETLLRRN